MIVDDTATVESDTEVETSLVTGDLPADDTGSDTVEGADAGDKPEGDDTAEGGDADEVAGAPEEYAEFTVPEGVELDAEAATEFKTFAKELNLPQEQAQKLVDQALGLQKKWSDAQVEAITTTRAQWLTESKADTEFGGAKLSENLATAKRALEAYGSEKLTELLDSTGLGNHPEVIRLLVKAGKSVSEDTFVGGKSKTDTKPKDHATTLYGSSKE